MCPEIRMDFGRQPPVPPILGGSASLGSRLRQRSDTAKVTFAVYKIVTEKSNMKISKNRKSLPLVEMKNIRVKYNLVMLF